MDIPHVWDKQSLFRAVYSGSGAEATREMPLGKTGIPQTQRMGLMYSLEVSEKFRKQSVPTERVGIEDNCCYLVAFFTLSKTKLRRSSMLYPRRNQHGRSGNIIVTVPHRSVAVFLDCTRVPHQP